MVCCGASQIRILKHLQEWLANDAPPHSPKPPLIWLELNACSGDMIAAMNSQDPNLGQVLLRYVDVRFSNALSAADGSELLQKLRQTVAESPGEFILIVEGAVPLAAGGLYTVVAEEDGRRITALSLLQEIGPKAKYVIAAGTCACYGGPSAASPNLSGSVGVRDVLDRPVINVSGCPNNPDWLVGTLFHVLFYGMPQLDEEGRPTLFYGFTVHKHCQRRSYFDQGVFAEELGEKECMFQLGCMGPRTFSDCPYRQWNDYVNWPVRANTPCIGCTNVDFPDGSTPFFTPLPEKSPSAPGNGTPKEGAE